MAVLAFQVFLRKDAAHPLGVLDRHGYAQYGLVSALVMMVTILISCLTTHGRNVVVQPPQRQKAGLSDRMREVLATLSNRSFLSLTIAGIVGAVGAGLSSGLGLYIATYFWELSSKEISYLVAFGFASAILGVSLAPAVAKRTGKKRAIIGLFAVSAFRWRASSRFRCG